MKGLKIAISYGWIVIGCAIYAIGFNWCYAPNDIAFGGLTGVAQVIHALLEWAPVGVMVIIFNIPVFLLGWKFLGGKLLVSSLCAMVLSSIMIDVLDRVHQFAPMEPLLASIYGGVLIGISLGIIFQQGASTGGTDTIARLLKLPFPWLSVGRLLLVVDLVIILAAALVFRKLDSALYGGIGLYISTVVMDTILYGLDRAKVAYIISDCPEKISKSVLTDIARGVTILEGKGGWSGEHKQVLMVAMKQRQIVTLKRTVKALDPHAFVIVCEAHEIMGVGFHSGD